MAGPETSPARTVSRGLLLLFVAALALRVVAVFAIGEYKRPNVWESGAIAESLVAGRGFAFDWRAMLGTPPEPNVASTWWPPAYPLFLAACHIAAPGAPYLAASLAQAALSAAIPILVFLLGRRLFGERAGWIAALIAAVHPPLLGFAALIQTALFEIFWTTLALTFAVRAGAAPDATAPPQSATTRSAPNRDAFLAGLAAAVAGLTRPPALAIVLIAPLAWRATGLPWRAIARRAAALFLGVALLIGPWVARNHRVRGEWILVSSNGGWNLYIGNNPQGPSDRIGLARAIPPALHQRLMTMNEVEGDRYLRGLALEYIRTHPAETARRVLARAGDLVWFNEAFGRSSGYSGVVQRFTRGIYQLSWGLLLPLAVAGMIASRRAWRKHLLLFSVIAANAAVILATFFVNRYRAPIEPILILFAAAAIERGLSVRRKASGKHEGPSYSA